MKALLRAAMTAALLAIFMFVLPVGALAEGNGYGHCINDGNPGHQGDDSNGDGHAADGGECESRPASHDDNEDDDDDDTDGNNAGGNGNDDDDTDDNNGNDDGNDDGRDGNDDDDTDGNNAGGNGNDDDDRVNKHGDDMPGRGLGHCRNAGNAGHDFAEEHGRGHLRDGGECDDDDTGPHGDDGDDGRDGDDGDVRAAGEGVMPIGFVDDDADGFDDTTGMTLPEVQAFNNGAADTLGEVAAAGGLATPVLAAGPAAAAASTPTPTRIDAGLGWLDLSASQNPLALLGMAAALTLALAYLLRRSTSEG